MLVTYKVQVGFEKRTAGVFRVGSSLIAPAVNTAGYDQIRGFFTSVFSGAYDDLTSMTTGLLIKRGEAQGGGGLQNGTIDLTCLDKLQLLDPLNTLSPLYGKIDAGISCRVQGSVDDGINWNDLAWGWLRSGDWNYDIGQKTAKFTFADFVAWLDRFQNPGPVINEIGECYTDDALNALFDEINWPAYLRDFDQGVRLAGFSADGSRSAKEIADDILKVSLGSLFQSRTGVAKYEDRYAMGLKAPVTTLDVGDVVRPGLDVASVKNVAQATKSGGEVQTYEDADSKEKYGPSGAGSVESPWFFDDNAALSVARQSVKEAKDPLSRVWQFSTMENPEDTDYSLTLATLDYNDKISALTKDYMIRGLQHKKEGGGVLRTSWVLSEAPPTLPIFRVARSLIAPAVDTVGYDVVSEG